MIAELHADQVTMLGLQRIFGFISCGKMAERKVGRERFFLYELSAGAGGAASAGGAGSGVAAGGAASAGAGAAAGAAAPSAGGAAGAPGKIAFYSHIKF